MLDRIFKYSSSPDLVTASDHLFRSGLATAATAHSSEWSG